MFLIGRYSEAPDIFAFQMPETLTRREKKSGPVAPALDYASSDPSIRQRGAVKRTRVFQGIERSVSVKQGNRKAVDINEFRRFPCQLVTLATLTNISVFPFFQNQFIFWFCSRPPDIDRACGHI